MGESASSHLDTLFKGKEIYSLHKNLEIKSKLVVLFKYKNEGIRKEPLPFFFFLIFFPD